MKAKNQRLILAALAVVATVGAALLAMSALKDQAAYFYSPADLQKNPVAAGRHVRLGGMVADRSIVRQPDGVTIDFVVADGPATEIKATVGLRTIRATLPGADLAAIAQLPGVTAADSRGESVIITCSDSDAAIRAFLPAYPAAEDIEVRGAGLEEAFLRLTTDEETDR